MRAFRTVRAALVRALAFGGARTLPVDARARHRDPRHMCGGERAWIIALMATSVVLAGVGYGATVSVAKRQALCSGGEARVTAWVIRPPDTYEEAFLRTRAHAEETWTRVEREPTGTRRPGRRPTVSLRAATACAPEQSGSGDGSAGWRALEQRRRDFDAHTSALAEADEGTVDRALSAVTALAPVADDATTSARSPPGRRGPAGPEVDAVQGLTVATGRALAAIGKYKPAHERERVRKRPWRSVTSCSRAWALGTRLRPDPARTYAEAAQS